MPKVATLGCGMLITLFILICIFHSSISAHLGRQYAIERRSLKSRLDSTIEPPRAEALKSVEAILTTTEKPLAMGAGLELPFGARLPQPSSPNVNLFEEYMSRGLYTCTSSYLDALGKLHALIAEVYADYQECQKLMKTTPKTFSRTDIDALDEMLDEWEKEDQKPGASSEAVARREEGSFEGSAAGEPTNSLLK